MTIQAATVPVPRARPDAALVLDASGVIQEAALSDAVPRQDLKSWIGRPWLDTVADSAKARRIVEEACSAGIAAFRQINQRFPSGLELPIEYTAVRLGPNGLIAVGKSLQAVAELPSRLLTAQQSMEREYWKLREVETRCRLLFDGSHDVVLMGRATNLHIVDANPSAVRALGLAARRQKVVPARDFLAWVAPEERYRLEAMLLRVRDQGEAPGVLRRLDDEHEPWVVRASWLSTAEGPVYQLNLTPPGPGPARPIALRPTRSSGPRTASSCSIAPAWSFAPTRPSSSSFSSATRRWSSVKSSGAGWDVRPRTRTCCSPTWRGTGWHGTSPRRCRVSSAPTPRSRSPRRLEGRTPRRGSWACGSAR